MRWLQLLCPPFRRWHWGSERWGNVLKSTEPLLYASVHQLAPIALLEPLSIIPWCAPIEPVGQSGAVALRHPTSPACALVVNRWFLFSVFVWSGSRHCSKGRRWMGQECQLQPKFYFCASKKQGTRQLSKETPSMTRAPCVRGIDTGAALWGQVRPCSLIFTQSIGTYCPHASQQEDGPWAPLHISDLPPRWCASVPGFTHFCRDWLKEGPDLFKVQFVSALVSVWALTIPTRSYLISPRDSWLFRCHWRGLFSFNQF